MTSRPPGQCCIVGVTHEGTAVGEIKKVGDGQSKIDSQAIQTKDSHGLIVRTYFSYPKDKKTDNAVLIVR